MGAEIPGIVRLKCSVQKYDWGKLGDESAVARLYAKNSREEVIGAEPYAELWIGTHDSGPSYVVAAAEGVRDGGVEGEDTYDRKKGDVVSLKDWIERNPSVVGDKVLQKWGPTLPFLLKVLSVEKALSIQAHPDKDLARILHKQQPEVYKDGNHKPEMALALTKFEALCGFVGLEELKNVVRFVPEMTEVVGNSCGIQVLNTSEDDGEKIMKEVLQSLFTDLMSASKTVISEIIPKLISRLNKKGQEMKLTDKEELVLRLEKQYPGDIGVIAAFLFNYVKLQPGEALYLAANEPHAYIQGECVECMATSDNVVRAGLTPKKRDVQTLCSMLTYKQSFPEILPGVAANPYTVKYSPPFEEFEVDCYNIPEEVSIVIPAVGGPCVYLVVAGEGTMHAASSKEVIGEGDVLFAPANTEITLETHLGSIVYRAGVNSRALEEFAAKLMH
ncbi:mannose-6-phosphate isomerase 1-like isoform X1 [Salvia splendens]|uniref:mannose-6-phosphate isomerase 1-like isoform X1 n=1 Tax=Salvia splendens TaxID=180675 RepID=UPI001C270691|nr:mannose-6-phosphate isomerase 1-like isoform X1 [Salvia splendens]